MEVEFSLYNALPKLVVFRKDKTWHARIDFDWADSFDGQVWPGPIADEDDKIDGTYIDWVKARGVVAALGAAAAHMDFPESIVLGPIPDTHVGFYGGKLTAALAFDSEEEAAEWSQGYDNRHSPCTMQAGSECFTKKDVRKSLRESVEND